MLKKVRSILSSWRLFKGVAKSLVILRPLLRLVVPSRGWSKPRRVVHVSPAYFGEGSYIGGGERYASCLAEAMAEKVETVLVTFGPKRESLQQKKLRIEVYPVLRLLNGSAHDPLCYGFLKELFQADVVHCYQYQVAVVNLAILAGKALGKRVFVTDVGGCGMHLGERFRLPSLVDMFLPISRFADCLVPAGRPSVVIYGGVDQQFIEAGNEDQRERKALFVGRLLPHKGINYLIEGLDTDVPLEVMGRPYLQEYFDLLQRLAETKDVRFVTDATDEQLTHAYRQARVTILPSVNTDVFGAHYVMPELLGLVMLESLACGTPVICTNVASLPEFVEDGVTGFVVPPNNPQALGERVRYLVDNPEIATKMGEIGRERVLQNYTWDAVASRCLAAYRGL